MYRPLEDSVSISEMMHMREELRLSNREIAERLGVSKNTVYRYIGPQPEGIQAPRRTKKEPELPPRSFTERLAAVTRPVEIAKEVMAEFTEQVGKHDVINHPKHYTREGAMESIDEMLLIFGKEAVMHFCVCNAWKYRYRAALKNGEEDIKKSDWYIKKYKELSEMEG